MNEYYDILLKAMSITAGVVFVALFFIDAGYGMMRSRQ